MYYVTVRTRDQSTRTQKIIYDALAQIRARERDFPYKLNKAYIISTAFSRAWLTEKKSPNPYISKASWKRKLTPAEVVDLIADRQHALLEQVKIHGMAEGYSSFARAVNVELATTGANHEVPLDWKFLSKRLGDGKGKNLHTGWGFQALRLSRSVRHEMTRVLQARPLYPWKKEIRSCKIFGEYLAYHLEEWQWSEKKWWFHQALAHFIALWNDDEDWWKKYFTLPSAIFPSEHQESLWWILRLQSFWVQDFLKALGLPLSTWHFSYDANKYKLQAKKLLMRYLHKEIHPDILPTNFTLRTDMVIWTQEARLKYAWKINISLAQQIYNMRILPHLERMKEEEKQRKHAQFTDFPVSASTHP
jgi:hypothetical protein